MICGCCERQTTSSNPWDGLYSCCNECAFCASLEHYPCCHGACERRPAGCPNECPCDCHSDAEDVPAGHLWMCAWADPEHEPTQHKGAEQEKGGTE